jgi:hypothetical protein
MVRPDIDPLTGEEVSREVEESKEKLRAVYREFDPLKPLRDHPVLTLGVAAVLGATMASPGTGEWLLDSLKTSLLRTAVAAGRQFLHRITPSPGPEATPPAPVKDQAPADCVQK